MQKEIEHILAGREKKITEEDTVLQSLPHKDFRFANPFVVLHHMIPSFIAPGGQMRIHPHPHRGFAAVTFQLQGSGYHKDSSGHYETINAGDVQWMFAGKGLLHSEGPTAEMLQTGGLFELIQLWVNVPASHKWDDPSYQSVMKTMQPLVQQQEGVNLRLSSGSYEGKAGALKSFTPVIAIIGEIMKGRRVQFIAVPGYWTLLYVINGTVNINKEIVHMHNLVVFEKENNEIIITAEEDAQILFLSAEPINEPVAAKGNFVMNTPEEIEQAFEDFKNGMLGTLDN